MSTPSSSTTLDPGGMDPWHSARMQASLAEEQESGRAKDAFLAMLGHELRNPLASISNAVYLLDRVDPMSTNAKSAREIIARQTGHLSRIVDDLLDVGRAVAGKMSLSMQPMELASIFNRLQAASALPLLTSADFEWGVQMRIAGATKLVA